MTSRIFIISIIVILSGTALCPAADNGFERELLPLLENHCFDCHDEDTQKGDLALHTLNPDVVNGGDEAVWAVVLDQLNSGKMPPRTLTCPKLIHQYARVKPMIESPTTCENSKRRI